MRLVRRKPCKECGVVKTLRMFYRHSHYRDGRMNICKECKRKYAREQYELKHEVYRPKHAARAATPKYRRQRAEYAKSPRGREVHRAACRRYYRLKKLFEARV